MGYICSYFKQLDVHTYLRFPKAIHVAGALPWSASGMLNSSIALSGICYSFYWLISFILFHCLEKDIKRKDKSIRGSVYCTVIYIFLHDYVYIFSAPLGIWRYHTFLSLPYLTANYHHCDDVFLRVRCRLQQ